MASRQILRDRWSGTAQETARAAVERLVTGESLDDLSLTEHEGRTDLRGLWLVSSRGLPGLSADPLATTPTAVGVRWSRLDLSGSMFRIDVRDADMVDVRLDHVGWRDWNVEASRLIDCSFVASDLGDVHFDRGHSGLQDRGPMAHRSRLERCDFSRTKFGSYSGFGRAEIVACRFAGTRFPSPMWFRGAALQECKFEGRFRTVCFGWTGVHVEPAPYLSADVAAAEFEACEVYSHSGPGLTKSLVRTDCGNPRGPQRTRYAAD